MEIHWSKRKAVGQWFKLKIGDGSNHLLLTCRMSEIEEVRVYEVDGEPLIIKTDEYVGVRSIYGSERHQQDLQEAGIIKSES